MTANTVPVASIVVPAHDEAGVLHRCLRPLAGAAAQGEFEIVVVSNGSTDATAEVARTLLPASGTATVVSIETASKAAALREGDRLATVYPRIYLDADVEMTSDDVRALAAALTAVPEPAVGAPELHVDTARSSSPVRAWYRAWQSMPYVADGVIGSGVYAVNAAGGRALGVFPDLINDDGWVRRRFTPEQRLPNVGVFRVHAPRTVRALVARRARIAVGNGALDAVHGRSGTGASVRTLLGTRPRRARDVYDLGCFVAITAAARGLGRWRRVSGRGHQWSTDLTSRAVDAP